MFVTRVLALALIPALARAQEKPPITPADYPRWESLGGATLSPDGAWLATSIRRVSGDGELLLRNIASAESTETEGPSSFGFSPDSRFLAIRCELVAEGEVDPEDTILCTLRLPGLRSPQLPPADVEGAGDPALGLMVRPWREPPASARASV